MKQEIGDGLYAKLHLVDHASKNEKRTGAEGVPLREGTLVVCYFSQITIKL